MPWLVNIGALPFVLVVGALLGAMALRALELLKPAGGSGRRVSNEERRTKN